MTPTEQTEREMCEALAKACGRKHPGCMASITTLTRYQNWNPFASRDDLAEVEEALAERYLYNDYLKRRSLAVASGGMIAFEVLDQQGPAIRAKAAYNVLKGRGA